MPSRWQTVLSIRKNYDVDFHVVAPLKARITTLYDPVGYLTPASAGLKDIPPFVRIIPLRDTERPTDGFEFRKLKSFLDDYQPDFIWIHGEPLQQVTRDICKWCFFSRKPKIYQAVIDNYQSLGKGLNVAKNWLLLQRITGFLTASQSATYAAKRHLRALPWKVFVTYLPNIPVTEISKSPLNNSNFNIGFVGRLTLEKGILVLLNALEYLPSEIHLFTAGEGEENLRRPLQTHTRVHHLGMLQDISQLLSKIDLLIVPSLTTSRWKEQFGRVIAEAFSCGIPVIGSDSGSIPDVIGNGGLIYPERSSKALSERILELFSNRDLYTQCSVNAKKRFDQHFSIRAHTNRLAEIFDLIPK